MARRTIKDFSAGLKRQIEIEKEALEALRKERDLALRVFEAQMAEQQVKITALEGVYKDLTEGGDDGVVE